MAFLIVLVAVGVPLWSQESGLSKEDKIRISEAFRLGDELGDGLWQNWSKAPFGLMLVADDYEYLLRHPHATHNFDTLKVDEVLKQKILYRKRLFDRNLKATFPAINGISTIVVGLPSQTAVASSTDWIIMILHEHFHQYQQSQPDYYPSVNALGLSHGDQTGDWMLNYPFPYDSAEVNTAFKALSQALLDALESSVQNQPKYLKFFFGTLERLRLLLSTDDFQYFSFQCWQEGVARYTELRVAEEASTKFKPGAQLALLKDYRPFKEVSDSLRSRIVHDLADPNLAWMRRGAFYPVGAGEALLLDKVHPGWRKNYFMNKFHLEKYFSQ